MPRILTALPSKRTLLIQGLKTLPRALKGARVAAQIGSETIYYKYAVNTGIPPAQLKDISNRSYADLVKTI